MHPLMRKAPFVLPRHHRTTLKCLTAVMASLLGLCFAQDKPDAPPKPAFMPKITISQETTWATEPLGPNGSVDYFTLFNRRAARGVTPENNAAVILSRALGPVPEGGIRGLSERYYELLGIDPLPKEGQYFDYFWKWWKLKEKKLPPGGEKEFEAWETEANSRPWKAREFPDLAEWLTDMDGPLSLAVQASERTEFFSPSVENADEPLCRGIMSVQSKASMVCRALVTRAMLRLGEENRFEAWNDLLTAHRLARLIGRGPFGMDGLIGYGTERDVIKGELQLISATQPSSKFTKRYLKQLGQLPPRSPIIDKIDSFERAMYLDACQQLARDRLHKDDFGDDSDAVWLAKFIEDEINRQVDWNAVLRIGNRRFDQLNAALRLPTYRERETALRPLDKELTALAERRKQAAVFIASLKSPKDLTTLTSDVMCDAWMPRIRGIHRHEIACQQWFLNLEIVLALSAWRSEHDAYPKSLVDLAPQYLTTVPLDLFTDRPLHYERTANGYRFYSLGFNGTDDQGRGLEDMPSGDDIAVQMPLPLPKAKP